MFRRCNKCKRWKFKSNMRTDKAYTDGVRKYCKKCENKRKSELRLRRKTFFTVDCGSVDMDCLMKWRRTGSAFEIVGIKNGVDINDY